MGSRSGGIDQRRDPSGDGVGSGARRFGGGLGHSRLRACVARRQRQIEELGEVRRTSVPLKVLEVDREHRKVVLSHRLATEEEREEQKKNTINALAEGQTHTGTVRRVTDYGAFIDLGGIDGLLHVSEMSWTRIKHPSDVVKVGDSVDVMILRLNLGEGRVSLGMRQILPRSVARSRLQVPRQ